MKPLNKSEWIRIFSKDGFLKEAIKLQPELEKMELLCNSFNFNLNELKFYPYNKTDFKSKLKVLSTGKDDNINFQDAKILYLELIVCFYDLKEITDYLKRNRPLPVRLLKNPESNQSNFSFSNLKIIR